MPSTNKKSDDGHLFGLTAVELATILPLSKKDGESAESLSSLSREALEAYHSDKIIDLGGKRKGMRRGHALMIGAQKK